MLNKTEAYAIRDGKGPRELATDPRAGLRLATDPRAGLR
jgi:hypothetical protein